MERAEYARFTEALRLRLERDPRVLGLVLLGSTSGRGRGPDRWSDHDFFLVVTEGAQEAFRTRLDWLPDSDRIAFSYRETAHGVKVLYRDGHLLELAVFSPAELSLARVNLWSVAFDRDSIAERMPEIEKTTAAGAAASAPSDEWLAGQFLTNLLVGVSRHARGERLAGRQLVKSSAVSHLLALLARRAPPPARAALDNLDPFRRFETAMPAIGAKLDEILERDTPGTARGLLEFAGAELPGVFPTEAVAAVRAELA